LEELQTAQTELAALKAVDENITAESVTALQENQLKEGQALITEEQTTLLNDLEELGGLETAKLAITETADFLKDIRLEAENAYKIIMGDNASPDIIAAINAADLTLAKAFKAEHVGNLDKTTPLTCGDCGSHDIR